jgi:mitochondrial chaperone BCS1
VSRLSSLGILEDGRSEFQGRGHGTSTAALQGLFLYNKQDMEGAVAMADGLVPSVRGEGPAMVESAQT